MSESAVLKRQAKELLAGIEGVRGIGFGWDMAGNQVLQVDLAPSSDFAAVKKQLDQLDTAVTVREIRGIVRSE